MADDPKSKQTTPPPPKPPHGAGAEPLTLYFARRRLAWLLQYDRAAIRFHLNNGTLAEHVLSHGASAATHYRREMRANRTPEDAEKEVEQTWIIPAGGEVPDPPADNELPAIEEAYKTWATGPAGPGRLLDDESDFDSAKDAFDEAARRTAPRASPAKR